MRIHPIRHVSLAIAAVAVLIIPIAASATATSGQLRKAESVCRQARGGAVQRAFAVYVDEDYTKAPRWVRKAPAKAQVVEAIEVIRVAGRIRAAKLTRSSPSGDWARYYRFCYRANGTLAYVRAELRTFHGNVKVVDRRSYGWRGRLIARQRRIYDLNTNKAIKQRKGGFHDPRLIVLKTTAALVRHGRPAIR